MEDLKIASAAPNKGPFNSEDEILALLENAPTNLMFCGKDLILKYINPKSVETLKKLEEHLPIPVEQIVGSSIDVFHKNPSHQQSLLSDPRNLPIRSTISFGPEKLDLLVSGVYGAEGDHVGTMLTWEIITEKLKAESELARIESMMENAPINIMCADLNGTIVYLNPKSKETLKKIESVLPVKADAVLGGSYDVFHRNPDYQRKLLADERNLPHSAKIEISGEKLDLLVSPMFDDKGIYLGPMVTWELITNRVKLVSTLESTAVQVSASAEELMATAEGMAKNSESISNQSISASSAAEEVSKGVEVVATNTEEMAASIQEISKSSAEAADMSKSALQQAQETNSIITELGAASEEIGKVIKVISSIAQQTNLLALNATIEAARAGEAGKGFAVVANEVKELAKQTAKATEDITSRIGKIQSSTGSAVTAIEKIGEAIQSLNTIAVSIAASVEEQSSTTSEVSRVVQESTTGVGQIAESIKMVAMTASEGATGATQTLDAAKGLSEVSSKLKALLDDIEV